MRRMPDDFIEGEDLAGGELLLWQALCASLYDNRKADDAYKPDCRTKVSEDVCEDVATVVRMAEALAERTAQAKAEKKAAKLGRGGESTMTGGARAPRRGMGNAARKWRVRLVGKDVTGVLGASVPLACALAAHHGRARRPEPGTTKCAVPFEHGQAMATALDEPAVSAVPGHHGQVTPPAPEPAGEPQLPPLSNKLKLDIVRLAARIHLLKCLLVEASKYTARLNYNELGYKFVGLMYLILHEDFDLKFGLSSFFLAVVGPQLLLRFRKAYAMEDLTFAALGMLGLLEGAEHNNKCNKHQRKHFTNKQPGAAAQHHIAALGTYLGALVLPQVDKLHYQALGGKPKSMKHRNRAAWTKYFGNKVLPEENNLRCCGCRTRKLVIHPMFRQFLPMPDHLPAFLPCAADAEAFLAQLKLCASSRVWSGGPPAAHRTRTRAAPPPHTGP